MGFKESVEFIYTDDLFSHPNGWKVYQILSICLAEFMGTFFVMVMGCAGYLQVIPFFGLMSTPFIDNFSLALGWGFAYACVYVCVNPISGYFLNPALSVTMMLLGHMSIYRLLLYIVCEFIGAIAGSLFLKFTMEGAADNFCMAVPPATFSAMNAMLYEALGSFSLGLLLGAVYDPRTRDNFAFGGVKFGVSITAIALALTKFTGCSLNPARSVATAIVAMDFDNLWIYVVGPFGGALAGGLYYQLFFHHSIREPSEAAPEEE